VTLGGLKRSTALVVSFFFFAWEAYQTFQREQGYAMCILNLVGFREFHARPHVEIPQFHDF